MADILHRIGCVAPLDDVYQAIVTPERIAEWWTTDTVGKSEVGGRLAFRFGEAGGFDMEIVELDPAGHVRWRVADGPAEWIGTEIDWRLERRGEWTIVLFKHEGWREQVEFMHHCSTKWATFLLSLKYLVEQDRGRPWPDELKVSDWT
ncbi:SRPBCC domain-containing protein [Dactylosporangium sucinum]|uniref:Activator of HSP90 ATPase n=1 Tax=Dactylosporangium sucinum TaxID=1424081 RepID=A0A917TPL7_9ACTN|nr:SRPBCC domain-containing protein [Dactylosporangium sucinum]GGM31115.1 activator of HSP90 ATPase [Dactylosporangium sucinum]